MVKHFLKSVLLIINIIFSQKADLVLKNGFIWTVDKHDSIHKALAISNDTIIFVGSNFDVEKYISPQTDIIDLNGDMAIPGFYDNHVHFESTGRLL